MPESIDTRDLLEACQRGEADAWDRFVRKYSRLVYSVANRYRFCDADADDVHQAVFLVAVKHLEQLRQADRVVAWLVTTAHREAWRVGRKLNRELDLTGDFADVDEPRADALAHQEELQAVREELANLSPKCQEVLRQLFLSGDRPDYGRLSSQLGMAIGSIGPTRMRCLEKLAALLRARGITGSSTRSEE